MVDFFEGVKNRVKDIKFFHSGVLPLDCSLGGGIAIGRWIETVGAEGTGKTSLMLRIASSRLIQNPQSYLLFLDAEQSLPLERIKQVFLDDENFEVDENGIIYYKGEKRGAVIPVSTYEEIIRILRGDGNNIGFIKQCIESGYEGIIVWDSLVALATENILKGISEGIGYRARYVQEIITFLNPYMYKIPMTLLTINQIRAKIDMNLYRSNKAEGLMSDIDYEIPAGKSHKFISFQTIFLQKKSLYNDYTKSNPKLHGQNIKIQPIKNKLYTPRNDIDNMVVIYEIGYSDVLTTIEYLRNKKLFTGKGLHSIKIKGFLEDKGMDLADFVKKLVEDDKFRTSYVSMIVNMYLNDYKAINRLHKFDIETMSNLFKYDAIKLYRHVEYVKSLDNINIFNSDNNNNNNSEEV